MRAVRTLLASLTAIVCGVCTPAHAGLLDIRIDLSTLQGSTPGNWNNISNLTSLTPNLIDFNTGAATSVSIDGTGSPWSKLLR